MNRNRTQEIGLLDHIIYAIDHGDSAVLSQRMLLLQEEQEKIDHISSEDVVRLREYSGCGRHACKSALEEALGDHDKAVEILKRR